MIVETAKQSRAIKDPPRLNPIIGFFKPTFGNTMRLSFGVLSWAGSPFVPARWLSY